MPSLDTFSLRFFASKSISRFTRIGILLISCLLPSGAAATGAMLSAADFQTRNLRGFTLSSRVQLADKDFQDLAASGAKLVRMSIALNRCPTCSDYQISARDLAYAKRVVTLGKTLGFYVVIALEPLPAGPKAEYWDNPGLQESIARKWQMVAAILRHEPTVAGYDLINEPLPPGFSQASQERTWLQFASRLVTAIRQIDPEHVIIVEVAPWGLPKGFSSVPAPLPYPNLVYSFHFYEPHQVTHQGLNNYRATVPYPSDATSGIGIWNKARLSALLEPARQFSRRYQLPIYVGEFSCIRWAPNHSAYRYIKDLTELFDAEGWSWTYHQFRGWDGWDAEIDSTAITGNRRSFASPTYMLLKQQFQRAP